MTRRKAGMGILALCSLASGCGGPYNAEAAPRNGVIVYFKGLLGLGTMEGGAMQAARDLDMACVEGSHPMAKKLILEARGSVYGPHIAGHSSGGSGAGALVRALGGAGAHFFESTARVVLPLETQGDPEVFNYFSFGASVFGGEACGREAIIDGQRVTTSHSYHSQSPDCGHVTLPSQEDIVEEFERNIRSTARVREK
jgi:hypothetical protein